MGRIQKRIQGYELVSMRKKQSDSMEFWVQVRTIILSSHSFISALYQHLFFLPSLLFWFRPPLFSYFLFQPIQTCFITYSITCFSTYPICFPLFFRTRFPTPTLGIHTEHWPSYAHKLGKSWFFFFQVSWLVTEVIHQERSSYYFRSCLECIQGQANQRESMQIPKYNSTYMQSHNMKK